MTIPYNPDVLTCLANLSSDEVFTPPKLANEMLDMLPADLWSNPNATFLDPACKSGVFLREIAKRLNKGLESQIPDLQARINHIFTKQLFGIAITELTALMSRRTVYGSKTANGDYSFCTAFSDAEGNIRYKRMEHVWKDGNCVYCGANEKNYNRGNNAETYAYNFIHLDNPLELFNQPNMQFDVIIGNPPYQLNDGGGTGSSARPIYHLFIDKAKKLNPRYISMVIPARWYSGGKGLNRFRSEMLKDKRVKKLVDYEDSRDCFPGVDIAGGICYFLWSRDNNEGACEVETIRKNRRIISSRHLDEFENFVRDNFSVNIIHKVLEKSDSFLDAIVSPRMPFGITTKVEFSEDGDIEIITNSGKGKVSIDAVTQGHELISKWKVLLSKTSSDHAGQPGKDGKRRIFSRVEIMPPNTVCTESYLVVGSYDTETEAENMVSYLKTKFCRFLVSTILLTQNITRDKFVFVPNLPMTELWTDEKLYKKYGLTEDEIQYIESMIRPMDDSENGVEVADAGEADDETEDE